MEELLLVNVCAMVFPVPAATPDMLAFVLTVQLNVVPAIVEFKAILTALPEQIIAEEGVAVTTGVGFTMMLYVAEGPVHAEPLDVTANAE